MDPDPAGGRRHGASPGGFRDHPALRPRRRDGRPAAINDYQGQYAADAAGNLRWPTSTRSTRRGGPAESLRLESAYLSALRMATRWEILSAGVELRLSTADGKTVLTFRRQADPTRPAS